MSDWMPCDGSAVDWLAVDRDNEWCTGLSGGVFDDSIWILHPIYEHPDSVSFTHEDAHRIELEARVTEPTLADELFPTGVVIGGSLGRTDAPGEPWRRVLWSELADRTGDPIVTPGEYPAFHCLPGMHPRGSWPASVEPPAEGSLDRDGWHRLLEILTKVSPAGAATECVAFYAVLATSKWTGPLVRSGCLANAVELYDFPSTSSSPSNLAAADRSWATWTDNDLWGTRVAGPVELIAAIEADSELETIRLPEIDARDMRGGRDSTR